MRPTQGDVHVNTPLTNISIAYIQSAAAFVATKVFPNVPVDKQSDRYYTYDRGMFNRDEMKLRGPATESSGGHFTVDNSPTYYAPVYAYHHDIDDQRRGNTDSILDPDREATELVTLKALIKREKIWAANFFATGKWTTERAGVATGPTGTQFLRWDDASSTPVEDIRKAKIAMLALTGFKPNTLVLGPYTFNSLIDHPDIVDRVKYGQTPGGPAMIDTAELQNLFKIPNVLVMESIENTANEGATNVHVFIGGKHALLVYAAPSPGLMTPSAGYVFSWTGYLGASADGSRVSRFRMEHLKSDRVEIEMAFDQKLIAADLGAFFLNAVS